MKQKILFLKPPTGIPGQNIVRDFVYGCWCNGRRVGGMEMPPLNDLYVATHAKHEKLESIFIDAHMEPERLRQLEKESFEKIFAVVVLTSTQSFTKDTEYISKIKSLNPNVHSIMFGSHPTFMPEFCLKNEFVDYIILREPEESIKQLIIALYEKQPIEDVLGIGYKNSSKEPKINPLRPFVDMNDLPIPDRTLLPQKADYFNPVVKKVPYTTMQTSRGCPGKCIFCTAPTFYGRKLRYRSASNVLEEFRQIKRLGYKEVFIRDETFTAAKARNKEICNQMIAENMDLSWIANGRVDMIDKETMQLMKKAGCHLIKFGVESGSNKILNSYKKGTNTEQAEAAFRWAHEVGLDTHAHLVLGGPGETPGTISQTIKFVKELDPTTASFGILTPYPGTELFEMVASKHPEIRDGSASNMNNLHTSGFYSESVCGLKSDYLSKAVVRAYRKFYLRPNYLFKRLMSIETLEELFILAIAGFNVIGFTLTGKK